MKTPLSTKPRRLRPRYLSLLIMGIGGLVILISFLTLGYDRSDASDGRNRIFQTHVTTVTPTVHGEWLIKGTTAAPAGSKVIVLGDRNGASVASAPNDATAWAVVDQNGRFTATIDAYTAAIDRQYRSRMQVPVRVVAVTALTQQKNALLSAGLYDQIQLFEPERLTLNATQARYCLAQAQAFRGSPASSRAPTFHSAPRRARWAAFMAN